MSNLSTQQNQHNCQLCHWCREIRGARRLKISIYDDKIHIQKPSKSGHDDTRIKCTAGHWLVGDYGDKEKTLSYRVGEWSQSKWLVKMAEYCGDYETETIEEESP